MGEKAANVQRKTLKDLRTTAQEDWQTKRNAGHSTVHHIVNVVLGQWASALPGILVDHHQRSDQVTNSFCHNVSHFPQCALSHFN